MHGLCKGRGARFSVLALGLRVEFKARLRGCMSGAIRGSSVSEN